MGIHSLCQSFFLLSLLFAVSLCSADDKTFEVVGTTLCADCNHKTSHPFSGLQVTIDCKLKNGDIKRFGSGDLDEKGKFKVSVPQELVEDGQKLKEECYAQLHSAAALPCAAHGGVEAAKIVFKSKTNGITTFTPAKTLQFSSALCSSKSFWPYFKHPPLPPHPWFKHPPLPPLPPLGHHWPPLYKPTPTVPVVEPPPVVKPLPPPVPVHKPTPKPPVVKKPCPPPFYKPKPKPPVVKPLPPPVPVYKPKPKPPVVKPLPPVYKPKPKPPVKKPCPPVTKPNPPVYKPPVYKPPVYKPPVITKPLPPPVPVYKPPVITKPLPPPVITKPLPPPVHVYKPPVITPIPKKPCPPLPKLPPIPPKYFHHPKFGHFPPLPPHHP